jgi:uncharacterized protein YpmB
VDTWNKTRQGPRLIDTIQPLRENTEAGVKCIQKEVDWVKTDGKTSLASGRTIRYNVFGECKPFVPSIMQVFRDEGLVVEKAEDSHHDFKLSLPQ